MINVNGAVTVSVGGKSKFSDDEQLLSVKDIMEYMHVGKDFAYDLFKSRKFKVKEIGKQSFVMKKDFMAYFEKTPRFVTSKEEMEVKRARRNNSRNI